MASTFAGRIGTGLAAGLAGALAIDACLLAWSRATDDDPRHGAFGLDEEADVRSARQLAKYFGVVKLSRTRARALARAVHYALGAGAGAVYAAFSKEYPGIKAGNGAVFGAGVWLIADELAMSVSGLSDPKQKSVSSHAAAFAMHVVFGMVVAAAGHSDTA